MRKLIGFCTLLGILCSCSKEPPPMLYFKMAGTPFSFSSVDRAYAEINCKLRTYEITAYTGDQFFKIDLTDLDTLKPGLFTMSGTPTNNLPGTATFWYSGRGTSYTAKPFKILVQSYCNGLLKASFGGGTISDGVMNLKILEQ